MITQIDTFKEKTKNDAIKLLDWTNNEFIYRSVTEGKLFDSLYFGSEINGGPESMLDESKVINYELPADYQDEVTKKLCSCWTMDEEYTGAAFNETYVRLVFNVNKLQEIKDRVFYGGGKINEAEIRIEGNIKNWIKYLDVIYTTEEFWQEGLEDDFGEFPALKLWLPKELHSLVKFKDEDYFFNNSNKIYKKLQSTYGTYVNLGLK